MFIVEALETAIIFTLYNCCKECHSKQKCVSNPEWISLSYEEIIAIIGDVECGDFSFDLDQPYINVGMT